MFSAILMVLGAQAATAAPAPSPQNVEPDPRTMSRSEVRTHNAQLAKDDPFYIRCERQAEVGSLVARKSMCRTNRQWAALEKSSREQIRGLSDDLTTRSASSGN